MSGPTPPGTGVIAEATSTADAKSTSPTIRPSTTLMPTSTTTAPGLEHVAGDRAPVPGRDDDDVGARDVGGEVARPRVADGDGRVLLDQQERGGHPDDRGATDDDRVAAGDLDPGAAQDLDRGMRRRRQESVVAERGAGRRSADGSRRCPWPGRCASMTARRRIVGGSGIWTMTPSTVGSAFSSRIGATTAASVASPSSSTNPASMPTLAQPRRMRSR